ncbi:redox-regulated ATPase YchF [Candidatus Microgenomates bacterium]|nr:redox-regulated ATPase YchF [Candidatus Microgenomates bacterium]
MNLSVGIIGLPNVGKSTLFNALLKKRVALSANYPFATVEPNVGVVAVPDERLENLAELVKNEEKMEELPPIVPPVVQFVDIAGLVKGAHKGEGLGNQFLSHIREVDAIVHVLRDFNDENVVRAGSTDPVSDRETVETELALADLQTIEKLIDAQEKSIRQAQDKLEAEKLEILNNLKASFEQGKRVKSFDFAQGLRDERLKIWFEKLPLLSIKPVLFVYNVSEEEYGQKVHDREENVQGEDELVICAKLEEDLADLSEDERREYLASVGLEQTGLERLIKKAYQLLGLISFLTAGPKEVRAWTIKKGTKSPQAAGVIHSDFEKHFIKADVIHFEELVRVGGWSKAREQGKVRFEGKEYVVQDGDVIEFKTGS